MSAPILFVVNPISGDEDKERILYSIRQWADQKQQSYHIWKTTGEQDKEKLEKQLKKYDPAKVVAVGGDGTLKLCAEKLKHTSTHLGLIPAGSANGMASELEIPADTKRALELIAGDHSKKIDLLQINEDELGMHISDIGLNASMVHSFEQSRLRGFLGYARGFLREINTLEPFEIEIDCDKEQFSFNAFMVAIANAKRYGTGALLNKKGQIDDGEFELCILKEFDLINIGKHFFDHVSADSPHMRVLQCQRADIRIKSSSAVAFQIDGEPKGKVESVEIKMLPQCLHMIVPH